MDDKKRFELYEKLYFHEVESKDKVVARLQIPLALVLSITSIYAFFIKGINFHNFEFWNVAFFCTFALSLLLFLASVWHFIKALYGHSYEFIPSALETEAYRDTLIEAYKNYSDSEKLVERHFNDYIFRYYNECSSFNTAVNDQRSYYLHMCNTYLISTALPLAVAFLIFSLTGIDINSVDKEYKVKLTQPISFTNEGNPIEVHGVIDTSTLEIDFSDDLKEIINEQ